VPEWESSRGVSREIVLARKRGIPLFMRISDLKTWLREGEENERTDNSKH